MPTDIIQIINRTRRVRDARWQRMIPALQEQIVRHFQPKWGVHATLTFIGRTQKPDPALWKLWLMDNSDEPGALGFHEDDSGVPEGKVFVEDDIRYGAEITVTVSHELLEMLADPNAAKLSKAVHGVAYAIEVCLAGETKVPLADGSQPPIGLLAERNLLQSRLTKRAAETVAVIFTDGTNVRCTPNHRFLLTDGRFVQASALKSGDMLPRHTPTDAVDRGNVYAISGRHGSRRLSAGPDGSGLSIGKFGHAMPFASHIPVPDHAPLRGSVKHVIHMGAEEQVGRVKARPNVAGVADLKTGGDLSFVEFIRNPMGEKRFAFFSYLPVSSRAFGSGPKPAGIGFVNPGPEPFEESRRAVVVGGDAGGNITVAALPAPIRCTETLCAERPLTSWNGTFHAKIVDRVERAGNTDVYDMTVPGKKNFAVDAGVFVHNCDPVEADSDGYVIGGSQGVRVSNFVTPAYFGMPNGDGSKVFDQCGLLTHPAPAMRPGGYLLWFNGTWHSTMARYEDGTLSQRAIRSTGRSQRRAILAG